MSQVNYETFKIRQSTIDRLQMIAKQTREYDSNPRAIDKETRMLLSMMMAATFTDFREFAYIGMKFLGFPITPMQLDIAYYMQHCPQHAMVAAQRGEAKSTLAALYAVWTLIQNNNDQVLVISAGEDLAGDIAFLIIRIIRDWHLLCYLRPDMARGDRTSASGYDVHCDLKAVNKTASVTCMGITANLPGNRATLLIADDIESQKNSLTQTERDKLEGYSKEFSAICRTGRILYLGTPQTKDSIYKRLPARGYAVRIWPGRYPTPEEMEHYIPGTVAPYIEDAMLADPSLRCGGGIDGNRGQPTDPALFNDTALNEKELDWGPEGFSLQYMLDTTLSDAMRTRIKLSDIPVGDFSYESAPEVIQYAAVPSLLHKSLPKAIEMEKMYHVAATSHDFVPYAHKCLTIDPAGSGGDEVSYAAGGVANSYVHCFTMGGLIGGMSEDNINEILDVCVEMGIKDIQVESNMGHGTVSQLIRAEIDKRKLYDIGVEDYYATGQKEKRIIDTLSPITKRHKFIMHQRAIDDDERTTKKHPAIKQTIFSGLYQISNITSDRQSLAKDDRADSLQALVKRLGGLMAIDDGKVAEARDKQAVQEFMDNPMGHRDVRPRQARDYNTDTRYF